MILIKPGNLQYEKSINFLFFLPVSLLPVCCIAGADTPKELATIRRRHSKLAWGKI